MLMYPIFLVDEPDSAVDISALPGQKRWGINKLKGFLEPLVQKGLKSVLLFGVPLHKPKVNSVLLMLQSRESSINLRFPYYTPGCQRQSGRRP